MLTLKQSDFRPEYKKRVNLHLQLTPKNQASRSSHSEQGNFGPHTVNLDSPNKKNESLSIPALNP